MNNFFRAIIAGYGAKKLGGGCFGTILVFILIWVALGQCSFSSREVPPPDTYPAKYRVCLPAASGDFVCASLPSFGANAWSLTTEVQPARNHSPVQPSDRTLYPLQRSIGLEDS